MEDAVGKPVLFAADSAWFEGGAEMEVFRF
jgi:hypothetical protein